MCLANLHGGAAEDKGKRVRFYKIGGGSRGGRGRTSASSLASSRGEIISIEDISEIPITRYFCPVRMYFGKEQ